MLVERQGGEEQGEGGEGGLGGGETTSSSNPILFPLLLLRLGLMLGHQGVYREEGHR